MGVAVMWIALEQVERVRAELAALPKRPVEKVPCKKAIQLLSPQIREMRDKGYSRREIAEALTAKGLPVSEAVLRSYERGVGDGGGRARGGKARKGATGSRSGARVESVAAPGVSAAGLDEAGRDETARSAARSRASVPPEAASAARRDATAAEESPRGGAALKLLGDSGAAGNHAAPVPKAEGASRVVERKSQFVVRNDTEDL
jgi:hypothetical protein